MSSEAGVTLRWASRSVLAGILGQRRWKLAAALVLALGAALVWWRGQPPAPSAAAAGDGAALRHALTRLGRGPGDADVVVTLGTAEFLQRAGMSELAEQYDPQRLLLFLIQEDLHEELPPPWAPALRVAGDEVAGADSRVLIDSGHHRLSVAVYPRLDAAGHDRLLSGELELTLPPVRPAAEPDVLRWDELPTPSDAPATQPGPGAVLAIPPAAWLGLFAGFLASMWPCLFQLTAYFIPSLAGISMAQARQAEAQQVARPRVLRTALFFVLGIIIVYTLGGTLAGLAAQSLRGSATFEAWRRPLMVVGALLILAMALRVAIQARVPLVCKMPLGRLGRGGDSPWATMLLGLAFATGCMTCFGAAMALGMATYIFTTGSALSGALIMFLFSLGIAVPLVGAAAAMARVMPLILRLEQWAPRLALGSSAVMVAFAGLLLTDSYHYVTDWIFRLPAVRSFNVALAEAARPQTEPLAGVPAQQASSTASPGRLARLQLVEGTDSRPLANGATVPVGSGLAGEVFVAPDPPRLSSDLDLYLFDPASDQPLADAQVTYTYEMVQMDHGIDRDTARASGDGHYRLPLEFLMFGDWLVTARIESLQGVQALQLYLLVLP